jgi:hypothetical protein
MTTATTWRKERGRETERLVAAYLRDHGWPYAEPVGAGRPGADITGTPGVHFEVKATKSCEPLAWLRQIGACLGDTTDPPAAAIWRPDGFGPASIRSFPVITDLDTYVGLLRRVGYGGRDADQ